MEASSEMWSKRFLFLSVISIGISHVVTQLTLLREFLAVFYGNELTIGIILANWMILTGTGAWFGRFFRSFRTQINSILCFQTIAALLPILAVFLLRTLRDRIFIRGEMLGFMQIFLSTFVILAPYCLLTGMLLTIACSSLSAQCGLHGIGTIYFFDNIGDIFGGFLFSFVLIRFFDSFRSLYVPSAINLTAIILFAAFNQRRVFAAAVIVITALLSILSGEYDVNDYTMRHLYEGQEVILHKDTRYGKLVVTRIENQFNVFENGSLLYSTEDIVHAEETVHYALAQIENPESVLLLSGGLTGTAKEILKHGVKRVDYVELDPYVVDIGKSYTRNLEDSRIHIVTMDGRLFVETAMDKYDAIILDASVPSTIQANRLYTIEFFQAAKKIMKENGVLSTGIMSSENFPQGRDTSTLSRILYKTLRKVFHEVIVIPGDRSYFIASDAPLTYDIIRELEGKGISTEYLNRYYAGSKLTMERIQTANEAVQGSALINKDFQPVICYYTLKYWLSHFSAPLRTFAIVIGFILFTYALRLKAIPFAVLTAGFSAAGLEIVIIVGFQILYGYVYNKISIIITLFMMGLAAGSFYGNRTVGRRTNTTIRNSLFTLAAVSAAIPLVLFGLSKMHGRAINIAGANIIIPIMIFAVAFIVGFIFSVAAFLLKKDAARTAGALYFADFVGASVGALGISALLIPLIGLIKTCLLTAALNILSGGLFVIRQINQTEKVR